MMFRILCLSLLLLFTLTACNKSWVPVDDPGPSRGSYQATQDGTYRVRRGDSLHAIAFRFGLDWRDIANWNGISAPYVIYPDQVLKLTDAPARSRSVTTAAVGPAPSSTDRAVSRSAATVDYDSRKSQVPASQPQTVKKAPPAAATPKPKAATVSASDPSTWQWPVEGRILSNFKANDPARNGIEIAGREGQPVKAAAPGEVVYSGAGLIGYGELIIVKHSDRMLSAYAHNRKRLAVEGQQVKAGEKIAEMGKDDRNRAMLHFEIRRDGNPQDPLKYLPRK
jgi:lipoprotein NlpD